MNIWFIILTSFVWFNSDATRIEVQTVSQLHSYEYFSRCWVLQFRQKTRQKFIFHFYFGLFEQNRSELRQKLSISSECLQAFSWLWWIISTHFPRIKICNWITWWWDEMICHLGSSSSEDDTTSRTHFQTIWIKIYSEWLLKDKCKLWKF